EGVELFQMRLCDPCLFVEHPLGGGIERLVNSDEAAGQRPATGERMLVAMEQQSRQASLLKTQQHQIDRDRRPLEGGRVIVFQEIGFGHRNTLYARCALLMFDSNI